VEFLIPIVVVVLGAWLTSRFSGQRALRDQSWARKIEAYQTVFTALYKLEEWCDYQWNCWFLEGIGINDRFPREDSKFTLDFHDEAFDSLFIAVERVRFDLSAESLALFERLKATLLRSYEDKCEEATEKRNAILDARVQLTSLIQKELGRSGATRAMAR